MGPLGEPHYIKRVGRSVLDGVRSAERYGVGWYYVSWKEAYFYGGFRLQTMRHRWHHPRRK